MFAVPVSRERFAQTVSLALGVAYAGALVSLAAVPHRAPQFRVELTPVKVRAATPAPSAPAKVLPIPVTQPLPPKTPDKPQVKAEHPAPVPVPAAAPPPEPEPAPAPMVESSTPPTPEPQASTVPQFLPAQPPLPDPLPATEADVPVTRTYTDTPYGDAVVLGLTLNWEGRIVDARIVVPSSRPVDDVGFLMYMRGQSNFKVEPPMATGEFRYFEARFVYKPESLLP